MKLNVIADNLGRDDLHYYAKLAQRKLGLVSGQVEVTSGCFQKCTGCESWRDHRNGTAAGNWRLSEVKDLTNQLLEFETFEHLSFTGGDPQAWKPLPEYLDWFLSLDKPFALQLSTAMTQDPRDPGLWRAALHDLRVSFDGADKETYNWVRGDDRDPADILKRLEKLAHPRTALITTVFPETVDKMYEVAYAAWRLQEALGFPLRRHMFLAVLGDRKDRGNESDFNTRWYKQVMDIREAFPDLNVSFAEDPLAVKKVLNESEEARALPCRIGNISFHLKADRRWFPCCLAGGEAITTHPGFCVGEFGKKTVKELYALAREWRHYETPGSPCANICQFKQFGVNVLAELAARTSLAMP